MTAMVPSLEGSLYLTDPQSIIGYTLRRYSRTPKDTVPLLPDMIISLPFQIAQFGREPDTLTTNIQNDLQGVFSRIFANDRRVTVNCSFSMTGSDTYDVSISVIYAVLSGEIKQTGTTLSLKDGRLAIPEDRINWDTNPFATRS